MDSDQVVFGYLLEELHVISNRVSRAESTRDLLKAAVEMGREKLGFERIGIWLFDREHDCLRGTFGTDEHGQTSDEHGQSIAGWHAKVIGSKQAKKRYWNFEAARIKELHSKYGYLPEMAQADFPAENVTAPLWSGEENLGIIAIDNFFSKEPIPTYRKDLLALYARTIGHLYERLAATEALKESRRSEKEFSRLLRELNTISRDLSRESDFDAFCKKAVEMGLQRLGYERLSLWLYDQHTDTFRGTFGTDENGNVRDERHIVNRPLKGSGGRAVVESKQNLFVRQNAPLYGSSDVIPLKNGPEAVAKL
ncbi:MAG: GAF domain-containing protein, partial [Candidatus Sumerlaeota bacterium]